MTTQVHNMTNKKLCEFLGFRSVVCGVFVLVGCSDRQLGNRSLKFSATQQFQLHGSKCPVFLDLSTPEDKTTTSSGNIGHLLPSDEVPHHLSETWKELVEGLVNKIFTFSAVKTKVFHQIQSWQLSRIRPLRKRLYSYVLPCIFVFPTNKPVSLTSKPKVLVAGKNITLFQDKWIRATTNICFGKFPQSRKFMKEIYSNAPNLKNEPETLLLSTRPETGYSEVLPLGQCFSTFLHCESPKIFFHIPRNPYLWKSLQVRQSW
jgi:hypothetical protein